MRRILLIAIPLLLLAAATLFWWLTRPLPVLTVTTWAGEYGRAQAAALMRPYAAARRVDVHIAEWDGDLDDVARAVARHSYHGDVIDFELPKAVEACHRGLLETIDAAALPPGRDGTPATKDFLPGAIGPCWVGNVVYSQAIAFDPAHFPRAKPASLADFFDIRRFPGPRALGRDHAKLNLEMALLADGVAPGDVYRVLDTDAGVRRALKKLASLRPDLVWWSAPGEPAQLLKSGAVAFTTILNGSLFDARLPGVIWDRQLYEMDAFAVPAGDPQKAMAMDFIRFATGTGPLAAMAAWVPYGPARRSAQALVGDNPELHIPMTPWLPTSHFATAFRVDDDWWRVHAARIAPLWDAFVNGSMH